MKIDFVKLIVSIIICQVIGGIGSIFTAPSISTWYTTLAKPWFTPPNWVFAPVWITLFLLMGISLYLIWEKGLKEKRIKTAISIFGIQLALNAIWSIIFFGLQSPFYAFIEIIILWIAILATIISFYKISKPAGLILLPYIIWVTIASSLNYYVWILNAI
ncbi:TspO/MBR family protein [Candidatus Aenigmatarchaeota archaeon]